MPASRFKSQINGDEAFEKDSVQSKREGKTSRFIKKTVERYIELLHG